MEFHYAIDHDHRLILVRRSGNWSAEQFIDSFESLRDTLSDCHDYDMVSDGRRLSTRMSPTDIARIAQHVGNNPLISGQTVLLVNKPMETALAMLYKNATSANLNISIFSTSEGVSEHLGVEIQALFDKHLPAT